MFIRIYNNNNDSFYLVGRPSNVADPGFVTTNIDGLTDLTANLSTISNAGIDGDVVSSSKLMPRTINVFLALHPTETASIDNVTNALKRAFPLKSTASLEWERDDGTLLTISGIVESIARPRFGDGTPARTMQISLYCSDPLFQGETDVRYAQSATSAAPLEIENPGEYTVGIFLQLKNNSNDNLPIPTIHLRDGDEVQTMSVAFEEFVVESGDTIEIMTERGKKSFLLRSESFVADYTAQVDLSSTWFAVPPGSTEIYCSDASFDVTAQLIPRYL